MARRTGKKRRTTKSARNPKKGAPKRSALTGKGRATGKPRAVKVRLDELNKARLILEKPEGTDNVGETRWLTPTKRGFNAVERMATEAIKSDRNAKRRTVSVYHYSLYVTFTGPNGQTINERSEGIGLPLYSWIAKRKGSNTSKTIQAVRDTVRLSIYKLLGRHFDQISPGKGAGIKMTEKQAARKMREIREGRNTKFKLVLYRDSVIPKRRKRASK